MSLTCSHLHPDKSIYLWVFASSREKDRIREVTPSRRHHPYQQLRIHTPRSYMCIGTHAILIRIFCLSAFFLVYCALLFPAYQKIGLFSLTLVKKGRFIAVKRRGASVIRSARGEKQVSLSVTKVWLNTCDFQGGIVVVCAIVEPRSFTHSRLSQWIERARTLSSSCE